MKYYITQEQINNILKLLGEIPFKWAIGIIQIIDKEIVKQEIKDGNSDVKGG